MSHLKANNYFFKILPFLIFVDHEFCLLCSPRPVHCTSTVSSTLLASHWPNARLLYMVYGIYGYIRDIWSVSNERKFLVFLYCVQNFFVLIFFRFLYCFRGRLHVRILVRIPIQIPIRFGAHPISHTIRISAYFKLDTI
jgi:hypothetical protein